MTIFGILWPKQNHLVIWIRHNGESKHLATPLSMYFLDMLVMGLFPIYFTQNHYFCFYFFTLAFYFVPSLGNSSSYGPWVSSPLLTSRTLPASDWPVLRGGIKDMFAVPARFLYIVQELCESRGGRSGLSVLTSLLVSVDVKIYCTVLRHWSQLVPNMSHDIWGH